MYLGQRPTDLILHRWNLTSTLFISSHVFPILKLWFDVISISSAKWLWTIEILESTTARLILSNFNSYVTYFLTKKSYYIIFLQNWISFHNNAIQNDLISFKYRKYSERILNHRFVIDIWHFLHQLTRDPIIWKLLTFAHSLP